MTPRYRMQKNLGIALEDLRLCRELLSDAGFRSTDGVNVSSALNAALQELKTLRAKTANS